MSPCPITDRSLDRLRALVREAHEIAASIRQSGPVDVRHEAANLCASDAEGSVMNTNKPLRRNVDGVCTRSTCECERDGLGDQCIWLKPVADHWSDCATNNAPAYPAGPCDCMPTPAMCRAAVVYLNGPEVYEKLPREVLDIEESIYREVWLAMQAAAPNV